MLSDKQRDALMKAYSDDYTLYADSDPMFGTHPKTIGALVSKGLIEPLDEDDETEYDITAAGRKALGLTGSAMKKPGRVRTAVHRAIVLFLGDTPDLKASIFPPKKLNAAVWVNDEQQADYSDAMMLVDLREADLGQVDEHVWSCVAKLLGELGWDCYVEANRKIVSFWPDD